jgi:hypothetical protein
MKFTCYIQKVDFFIDQMEDKGEVNLEKAIEIFQNFPFDLQLKEARNRELTYRFPTVFFKSSDGKGLGIWKVDFDGFYIYYDNNNQVLNFFLSNNFEKNPKGLLVEEFIEYFFHQVIEDKLSLVNTVIVEKEKTFEEKVLSFSFNASENFKSYFWTLPILIIYIFLSIADAMTKFDMSWTFHLLFIFMWLPTTLMHISYWLINYNAIVTIDSEEKTLTFKNDNKHVSFKREDIHYCELVEVDTVRIPWKFYRYLLFELKDKRKIIITSFITEPENILNALKPNYKVVTKFLPFPPPR